jgi:hypothetical protein
VNLKYHDILDNILQWMRVILNKVMHVHGENKMVEKLAGHSRMQISRPVLCSRK